MKIYIPNISKQSVGGGWTWMRNFKKAMQKHDVHFVDKWEDCDVFLIAGVTITKSQEVRDARRARKAIVLRVDNVPKKSRNKRCTPHQRLKEFAELSDVVIYQSEWAKEYCMPLCGEGTVIMNGVDTDIFYPAKKGDIPEGFHRYLFAYHGKSELKQFWLAHYYFQMIHRHDPNATFWFINDFGKDLPELQASNFDFWNGETYVHHPKVENPINMASLMRDCTHFICPYTVDAAPNTLLEARACGLIPVGLVPYLGDSEYLSLSGVKEYEELKTIPTLEDMGEEYFGVLSLAVQDV